MPGLGETRDIVTHIHQQREAAMASRVDPSRLTLVAPNGTNPGGLRMLAYAPPGLLPGAPLVVVLHGCGQTALAYDQGAGWSALANQHGFALLYPEQQHANNGNLCFNWFQPSDVRRGSGEALSIRQMVAQAAALYESDLSRVYLCGLSAGGAMAAAMLATYPEVFAGGAVLAGLPFGAASSMQEAVEAMYQVRAMPARAWGEQVRAAGPPRTAWPHVQVWHGGEDTTVKPGNATELVKQWANVHGVPMAPSSSELMNGAEHRTWLDRSGRPVLESYTIRRMGHGVPLHSNAPDMDHALGNTGPFMVDAGISSTWHIARSWSLLTQPARARVPAAAAAPDSMGLASFGTMFEDVLRAVGLPTGRVI